MQLVPAGLLWLLHSYAVQQPWGGLQAGRLRKIDRRKRAIRASNGDGGTRPQQICWHSEMDAICGHSEADAICWHSEADALAAVTDAPAGYGSSCHGEAHRGMGRQTPSADRKRPSHGEAKASIWGTPTTCANIAQYAGGGFVVP